MKINAAWHTKHPMPPKASFEQRVRWHLAHAKHCACRAIPRKLLEQMNDRGLPVPPTAR